MASSIFTQKEFLKFCSSINVLNKEKNFTVVIGNMWVYEYETRKEAKEAFYKIIGHEIGKIEIF